MNEPSLLPEPKIVPWQMREARRWCQYALVPKDGGGFSKVPHAADGDPRVINKPKSWASLSMALLPNSCKKTDGIGFITGDEFLCIDLDNCLADDGTPNPLAREIVDRLGSFTEISLSGKGLHIWAQGSLPPGIKSGRWETKDPATGRKSIEVKGHGCYVTFSGNHLPGTPAELVDVSVVLAQIIKPAEGSSTPLCESTQERPCDNATLLYNARTASNGPKFSRLYDGEPDPEQDTEAEADESVDDQRLLAMLHYWTKANREWAFEFFMDSARGKREKVMTRGAEYLDHGWRKLAGNKVFSCDYRPMPLECTVEPQEGGPVTVKPDSLANVAPDDLKKMPEVFWVKQLHQKLGHVKAHGDYRWWTYRHGVFAETSRDLLREDALKTFPDWLSTARGADTILRHLAGLVQIKPGNLTGFYRYDSQGRVLINCSNCVLRVSKDSIQQLDHSPDFEFFRQTAAAWNPMATAPRHTRLMEESLPDPMDRELFWDIAGNILLPDCSHEAVLCCYGKGGNGKDTCWEPFGTALGEDLTTSLGIEALSDPKSFELPDLQLAALNLSAELSATEVEDPSLWKKLISGNGIRCARKYEKGFDMKTSAKHVFLSNNMPRFKHGTGAEGRRLRILHFKNKPKVIDTKLKGTVRGEAEGVFTLMVKSLQELLRKGAVSHGGKASRDVHERFCVNNDPLGQFIESTGIVLDEQAFVPKNKLRIRWEQFREEQDLTLTNDWFFKTLRERLPDLKNAQRTVAGDRGVHVYLGIGLTDEGMEQSNLASVF